MLGCLVASPRARATMPCQRVCDDCAVSRYTLIPDGATDLPTNLRLPLVRPPSEVRLLDAEEQEFPFQLEEAPGGYVTWLVPDATLEPYSGYVVEHFEYSYWRHLVAFETGAGSDLAPPAAPPPPLVSYSIDRYLCEPHVGATVRFSAVFPMGTLVRLVVSRSGEPDHDLVLPYEPEDINRKWPMNGVLYLGDYTQHEGSGDCLRIVPGVEEGASYLMTASVIDLAGLESPPSAPVTFQFYTAGATDKKSGACGCSAAGDLPTSAWWLPLLFLGLLLLRRTMSTRTSKRGCGRGCGTRGIAGEKECGGEGQPAGPSVQLPLDFLDLAVQAGGRTRPSSIGDTCRHSAHERRR